MARNWNAPWTVERDGNGHAGMIEVKGPRILVRGFTLATDIDRVTAEQIEDEAELIAVAPDMLSLVKRWHALEGGAWHPDRLAAEKRALERDTQMLFDRLGEDY